MKFAARSVLVLAVVIGMLAISNFAYKAYMYANCSGKGGTNWLGVSFSDEACADHSGPIDESLRYDATAAVVATAFLIGSLQSSRRIPKRRAATPSSGNLIDENRVVPARQPSRHKSRRTTKTPARILLFLALVMGILAVSDFAYNAYQVSIGFDTVSTLDGDGRRVITGDDNATKDKLAYLSRLGDLQRWDAAAAVVAVTLLISSSVMFRRLRRHRRRSRDHGA